MAHNEYENRDLCKKCYIKFNKLSKKDIKKMVMSDYQDNCDACGRKDYFVEYLEEEF